MSVGKLKPEILSSRQNLLWLCLIRSIVVVGLLAITAWFQIYGTIAFPSLPMFLILSAVGVINVGIMLRLRSGAHVSQQEFFANLLLDIFFLTLVLYFTGGSTNPIVSY
jgi:two-component system sensor histidine kinase RegB